MLLVVLLASLLGVAMARTLPVFALLPVLLAIVVMGPSAVLLTGSIAGAALTIMAVQAGYFAGSILWTGAMRRGAHPTPQFFSVPSRTTSNTKSFGER